MENFLEIIFLLGIAAICSGQNESRAEVCPVNEQTNQCENPCQATCEDPKRTPCPTFDCGKQDCICKKDFLRINDGGSCVPAEKCPKCSKNEEPSLCFTPCQPTCDDPNRKPCPTLWCGDPGCVCKKGFIRVVENGPCIPIEKCRKCGANEMVTQCDTPCQATCDDPDRQPCPTFQCGDQDCVCKEGYVRLTDGGPCVRREKCRKCSEHEQLTLCDTPCQPSCQEPDRLPCPTLQCGDPDCVCKPGYIRSNYGNCIRETECVSCGRNEISVRCDVPCQPTCQSPDREPCPTKRCGGFDCVCKEGFIRYRENGRCVHKDRCYNFLLKPSE